MHPGGELKFSVASLDTRDALLRVDYWLERRDGDRWLSYDPGYVFVAKGSSATPRTRAPFVAKIPADAPTGRYRLSRDMGVGSEQQLLTFEFDVVE
jgi:hypothetical protein